MRSNRLHVTAIALLLFVGGLIAIFGLPVRATAATPTATYESQAWWNKAGIVVPTAVGSHIHVKATVPLDGALVDGLYVMPVTITLHNARGALSWFRVGTEDTMLFPATDISKFNGGRPFGPCADCSVSFNVSLNLGSLTTGRHELRMSANDPDEDPNLSGYQRMYQSTGYQFCVRACTPSYRPSTPSIEARGWYTNHFYANASLTSARSTLRSGGTITVRLGPGSGPGLPTKLAGVYIDPDFHHGSAGKVVDPCPSDSNRMGCIAAFRGSVTLPTLASGAHALVLLSSDGQNAGVLKIPFVVP